MADYGPLGGVKIAGFISPGDTTDTYAVIDTILGIDGLRNYSGTTTEVLSGTTVPLPRRRAGMIVGVEGGDRYFKLKDKNPWDFDLTDWEELNFSGGGSGSAITGGTYSAGALTLVNGSGDTLTITGFTEEDTYTDGATLVGSTLQFDNNVFGSNFYSVDLSSISGGSGSAVTAYTYSDNNFTIKQSGGEPDLTANISVVTGLTVNGDFNVNGESIFSGNSTDVVKIFGSGDTSPIFSIEGSVGELLSVNDGLNSLLFAVNDISGLPTLQVFDNDTILMGNNLSPSLNSTTKINPGTGLSTIYSLPMSAYTGAWFEYTVKNTGGARAGQIMSIFSGNTVNFTETTTTDIGSTSDISFSMSADSVNSILQVSATTTGWEIKTIVRSI